MALQRIAHRCRREPPDTPLPRRHRRYRYSRNHPTSHGAAAGTVVATASLALRPKRRETRSGRYSEAYNEEQVNDHKHKHRLSKNYIVSRKRVHSQS